VRSSGQDFAIDRTAVVLIVAVALVITPAVMLASVWVVTDGLDFAAASAFELVVAALVSLLVLLVIRATVRELIGTLRVRIDERGVEMGDVVLSWAEVETLAAPTFGVLELAGNGKRVLLRTYLYEDRTKLLAFIAQHSGKGVPNSSGP
jgi:uncharacterized membrane protein YobD (UPF0266 family)